MAKRLIPAGGQVHNHQPTLRALINVRDSPGLEFMGTLTLYWNMKDPKVTAVHWGKTEKRSSSDPFESFISSFLAR